MQRRFVPTAVTDTAGSVSRTIRGSVSNVLLTLGLAIFALAMVFEVGPSWFEMQGVWAAILGLWGLGLVTVAVGIKGARWWARR